MLKIAIVEDSDTDYRLLNSHIEKFQKEHNIEISVDHFANPVLLLEKYSFSYDLIFFDIMMPGINGMEAAKMLRLKDTNVSIIFITSLAQYAIEGYSVQALDYILKPINYYDFSLKFSRALEKIIRPESKAILIKSKDGQKLINIQDILYVESVGHNAIYHLKSGELEERRTLKEIEAELNCYSFSRCNSCYIVNLNYLTGIKGYECFIGNITLTISQPRKKPFLQDVTNFINSK